VRAEARRRSQSVSLWPADPRGAKTREPGRSQGRRAAVCRPVASETRCLRGARHLCATMGCASSSIRRWLSLTSF